MVVNCIWWSVHPIRTVGNQYRNKEIGRIMGVTEGSIWEVKNHRWIMRLELCAKASISGREESLFSR